MTKDTALGWVRTIMVIVGSFFIGKVISGHDVTGPVLDGFIGSALFVVSVVWGVFDKTANEEMINSALYKVITFAGGLAVSAGWIKANNLEALLGLVPLLAAEIIKRVNSQKDARVAAGTLGVSDLSGAAKVVNKGEAIKPVINTPAK
jgi:hypothetical protein